MSQRQKFLRLLLDTKTNHSIDFTALCHLLVALGFEQRIRGSHHVFGRAGIAEIINLQPGPGNTAKPYQVKQVRQLLLTYQAILGLSLA